MVWYPLPRLLPGGLSASLGVLPGIASLFGGYAARVVMLRTNTFGYRVWIQRPASPTRTSSSTQFTIVGQRSAYRATLLRLWLSPPPRVSTRSRLRRTTQRLVSSYVHSHHNLHHHYSSSHSSSSMTVCVPWLTVMVTSTAAAAATAVLLLLHRTTQLVTSRLSRYPWLNILGRLCRG